MSNLIEFKEIKEIDKILFQIREKTSTQKDKISLIVEKRNHTLSMEINKGTLLKIKEKFAVLFAEKRFYNLSKLS